MSMDSAHDRDGLDTDDLDELIFTVVEGDQPALVTLLRLDQPTVAASVAASVAEAHASPLTIARPEAADVAARERYGRSLSQLTSQILSLVLYLTSEEPDAVPTVIGRAVTPRSTVTATTVAVTMLEVGARLGVALRASARPAGAVDADGSFDGDTASSGAHRPVAHMRRAHWHTYWTGPRADPSKRVAKLRWIHMIQVGTSVPVTVRAASSE